MQQQPDSPTSTLTVSPDSAPGETSSSAPIRGPERSSATHPHHPIPRWLERVELFVRVMLRMYIGLAICYAPWSHTFWDLNPLFLRFPALGNFAATGAVRGIVSGLGLMNLWIAFHDAIRHRDG